MSPRAPGRALPWRRTGCQEATARKAPAWSSLPPPEKAHGLLEGFCPELRPEEQVAVNSKGRLLLLRLADIDWVEAADGGVALHVGSEMHLIEDTLAAVTAKLPPGRFLRISPSTLVNVAQIRDLRPMCRSEWQVLLRDGRRLILTRGYGEHLRQAGWFLASPTGSLGHLRRRAHRPASS